jgi:hypothetical protein
MRKTHGRIVPELPEIRVNSMETASKSPEILSIREAYREALALSRLLDHLVVEAERMKGRHGWAGRFDLVIRVSNLQRDVVRRLRDLAQDDETSVASLPRRKEVAEPAA